MINLFFVEKLVNATETELIARPCTAKKLRITFTAAGNTTPAAVIFRDGGPTGDIKARLTITTGAATDSINCNDNEVLTFATSMFVQVSGTAMVQAYLMGNPVGKQGS